MISLIGAGLHCEEEKRSVEKKQERNKMNMVEEINKKK